MAGARKAGWSLRLRLRSCLRQSGWADDSVPEISFVKGDAVLEEEGSEFILEVVFFVMLILGRDVLFQGGEVGGAYREDAVAALPCEVGEFGGLSLEPR